MKRDRRLRLIYSAGDDDTTEPSFFIVKTPVMELVHALMTYLPHADYWIDEDTGALHITTNCKVDEDGMVILELAAGQHIDPFTGQRIIPQRNVHQSD